MDAPGPAPIKGRVRRMSARPEVQPLEAAPAPRERRSSAAVLAESALRAEVLAHPARGGAGMPAVPSQKRVYADDRPTEGPGRRGSVKSQAWSQNRPELETLESRPSLDDLEPDSDEEDAGQSLTPGALYEKMRVADEHLPELPGWWFESFSLMTRALDLSGAAARAAKDAEDEFEDDLPHARRQS